jgi:hypothetical protein
MDGMQWYLSLSIHQKISLKEASKELIGVGFSDLSRFGFTFSEKIQILHTKLRIEGILP